MGKNVLDVWCNTTFLGEDGEKFINPARSRSDGWFSIVPRDVALQTYRISAVWSSFLHFASCFRLGHEGASSAAYSNA